MDSELKSLKHLLYNECTGGVFILWEKQEERTESILRNSRRKQ